MVATLNTLMIAFFDGIGDSIVPTANFTPPVTHPLSNLMSAELDLKTRTPDTVSNQQMTWDLLTPTEFNVFALIGSNATTNATYRFRAADDAGFTTGVVESGGATLAAIFEPPIGLYRPYVPAYGRTLIYVLSESVTKQYVRWHQTDSGNPDGYQSWGVARIGLGFQSLGGFEPDSWKVAPKTYGIKGSELALRGFEMTMGNLTQAEALDLEALALSILSTHSVLVIPEPLNRALWPYTALWATLENTYVRDPIPGMSYTGRKYRVTLSFRETDR